MQYSLAQLESREIAPGYHAKFIHTENVTLAYWDIKAGEQLPSHSHPHEQILNMLSGQFELIVDDKPIQLTTGDVFVLHSGVVHAGRALSDCRILDVFQPTRDDYRFDD